MAEHVHFEWLAVALAAALAVGAGAAACAGDDAVCADSACGGGGGQGGGVAELECPASGVLYGPWALHISTDSALVRWDGCDPHAATITVEPEAGGTQITVEGTQTAAEVQTYHDVIHSVPPDLPGTRYLSEVAVTGLEAGRCYRYALVAEPVRAGRFCTAAAVGQPLRFSAIGDTNPAIGDTAGVIDHAVSEGFDFTLHMGDLQYYASVFETWATWFPAMQPLLSQAAFLPCPGNHEFEIDHEFEDYYVRLFGGAGFDSSDPGYYRFSSGGVWFFSLDTETDLGAGSAQADWIEAELADASSQPGYRGGVAYLHRPMMTLADVSQKKAEREHLAPLFVQYGIKLVLQGHVHGYERFLDGELTYITTGGGGAALHDLDVRAADRPDEAALRQAAVSAYHAVIFDVTADSIDGRAISHTGELLDSFSIPLP